MQVVVSEGEDALRLLPFVDHLTTGSEYYTAFILCLYLVNHRQSSVSYCSASSVFAWPGGGVCGGAVATVPALQQ